MPGSLKHKPAIIHANNHILEWEAKSDQSNVLALKPEGHGTKTTRNSQVGYTQVRTRLLATKHWLANLNCHHCL